MAYTRKDTGDGCYGQNSFSQSEATPQPYSPEQEQHANAPPPPHCVLAVSVLQVFAFLELDDIPFEVAPPVHCSSYLTQRNAPTLHSSAQAAQDQRYGMPMPYINDMARGYSGWTDAQQSAPFIPQAPMAIASIAFS
jgi:hypothetical protein